MSGSFISIPSITLGKPETSDRTSDLQSVIIRSESENLDFAVHVRDADLARKWAAEFTRAAELLKAMGPDKFCPKCGNAQPGHVEGCPRRPA